MNEVYENLLRPRDKYIYRVMKDCPWGYEGDFVVRIKGSVLFYAQTFSTFIEAYIFAQSMNI